MPIPQTYDELCTEQISRLAGQREYPDPEKSQAAFDDLVDKLKFVGRGEREFVKRVIDTCKNSSEFCPRVNDLASVAAELREADKAKEPGPMTRLRKEYGPPQRFDVTAEMTAILPRARKARAELQRMNLEIYAALGAHTPQQIARLSLNDIFRKQRELGYSLTKEQKAYL